MAVSLEHAESKAQRSGALPPWLWFWLVIYILNFSTVFDSIKTNLLILFTGIDAANPGVTYSGLERVSGVVEVLLDLVLFAGVFAVFLPWIRTVYLRRRYGLAEPQFLPEDTPQETVQALNMVGSFVKEYAPGLILTYNAGGKLLRDKAFVYPIGYSRAGLAISGTLLALWSRDRQAAEAILLHEIEHYRHGDMLVVGAGSLLETIIRRWFLLTMTFVVVPLLISLLIEHITFFRDEMALTSALPTIISFHVQQVIEQDIPFTIFLFLRELFWTASLFSIIVIAIWSTELNADRFVVDTTQSTAALSNAMQQHATSPSWRRWLLSGLHHPPARLRRWLMLRSERTKGLMLLLLVFPAAWFLRLFFLIGWALSQYLVFLYNGASPGYIVGELGINVEYFLEGLVLPWIAMAVLIALWPVLARYWERLFGNKAVRPAHASYRAYLSSTGFVVLVCIVGLVLSLLPPPAQPAGATPTIPSSRSNRPSGHFEVGETAAIGTLWSVTVNRAQAKPDDGLLPAKAGDAYVAIDVTLKNISAQTNKLASDRQFILKDIHGISYDETYVAAILPPAVAQDGNVPAGAIVQGQLNYEVPASISQFTLSFEADLNNLDPSLVTIWDITVTPLAVPVGTSVATAPVTGYPTLRQAYSGTLVNTTGSSNTSAGAALSSIVQVNEIISGNMTIQLPLAGSGPFTGTVSSKGAIQFTVIPTDDSGYAGIVFTGTVHSDGSMSGTYTLPGTGQGGTWQFKPA